MENSSKVTKAIELKSKLRHNGKVVENIKIMNVLLFSLETRNNPDSNYEFRGQCTIRFFIKTDNGDDYMDFPNCKFNGFAFVKENETTIVQFSVNEGLPNNL